MSETMKLDLEGLRYHACSSGTSTPPMVRDQILAACAEIDRLTVICGTLDKRCADALADEVDVLVRRKVIDARSPAADALLDYRNPPSSLRSEAIAKRRAELDQQRSTRDDRQRAIHVWARAAFGDDQATSLPQRATRLLEEAIELYQACGTEDPAMAKKLVDYVFDRPPGEISQEIGGVAVCLLALAAAAGLSADREELREIERVLNEPIEEFTRRNAAKNAAGFDTTKGST